jgi:ricin-type beta-trefoil lectin protein
MPGLPAALTIAVTLPLGGIPDLPLGLTPLFGPDRLFRRRRPGVAAVHAQPTFQFRDPQLLPAPQFPLSRQFRQQHRDLGVLRLHHSPQPGQQRTLLPGIPRQAALLGRKPHHPVDPGPAPPEGTRQHLLRQLVQRRLHVHNHRFPARERLVRQRQGQRIRLAVGAEQVVVAQAGLTSTVGPVVAGDSAKCVDDNGGSTTEGTKIQMWTCGGGTNQSWSVAPYGTIRVYGKCMDVSGAGTSNGTLVDLYDCNGGTNQESAVP